MVRPLPLSLLTALLGLTAARGQGLFPDRQLEAAVRQQVLGKKYNQEPLTEEDVKHISTVIGKRMGIRDLTGLEKCRSLALLDLEDNEIQDLSPLRELEDLQSLDLSYNRIRDLEPLRGLTKLQYLRLEENQISDLSPLAGLTAMRSLYLSRNRIEDIGPLAAMKHLWSLYLGGNQVRRIDTLGKLRWLSALDLRENGLADVGALSELTELRYLFLQQNLIRHLEPLLAMARKDLEGEKRFAPFWHVSLDGNPLERPGEVEELRRLGVRVRYAPADRKRRIREF